METININTQPRQTGGKGPARQLRREGRTPAVIYGHAISQPVAVSLDPRELDTLLANPKGSNAVFDLPIEGTTHKVLIREIQRHPVSRSILHVDLVATDVNRRIVASVPVRFTGRSIGVQAGGYASRPHREVRLSAMPDAVPAEVVIDITELDQDDSVMASQIELPEGVEAVYDRDYVVVKITTPRGRLEDELEEVGEAEGEAEAGTSDDAE